jgi:hypothetical protein
MTDAPTVIAGHAYQRRATLELAGETLTWRAQRGDVVPIAENIVTTIRDVRDVRWTEVRWSIPGVVLAGLSAVWSFTEGVAIGAGSLAAALALIGWRVAKPRRWLVLDLDGHRLVLAIAPDAAAGARAMVRRIEQLRDSEPGSPPALP